MTTTIALCNLKGGTGKTTTAIYMATIIANWGHRVVVLDADPQGSATAWADIAAENEPLPFEVVPANARVLARPRREDVVIIDCPPGGGNIITAAVEAADLVLIPTCPSAIEVDRMWSTVELAEASKTSYAVLLTSAQLGTKALEELRSALDDSDTPWIRHIIPQRMEIKRSWGGIPMKAHGYDFATADVFDIAGGKK
ncbi:MULTISPECIES: ParA family protein [Corynebacterium]|uniref:ParA family protein n=1 Tax=Corynebacterium TaxID=1716 RepID=UPI00124DE1D8|nr:MULTISPECIES: ParA family protein [Corynebacterium]